MRVGVLSDTHGSLHPAVFQHFADVDLIVHAGDIGPPGIIDDLGVLAPVVAVWGNTDGHEVRGLVPEIATQELAGRTLVVLHGHQHGAPTPPQLTAAHPHADVIVYGHTHRPLIERHGRQLVLNPGSAGAPRFGMQPTIALLEIDGAELNARLVELARR